MRGSAWRAETPSATATAVRLLVAWAAARSSEAFGAPAVAVAVDVEVDAGVDAGVDAEIEVVVEIVVDVDVVVGPVSTGAFGALARAGTVARAPPRSSASATSTGRGAGAGDVAVVVAVVAVVASVGVVAIGSGPWVTATLVTAECAARGVAGKGPPSTTAAPAVQPRATTPRACAQLVRRRRRRAGSALLGVCSRSF